MGGFRVWWNRLTLWTDFAIEARYQVSRCLAMRQCWVVSVMGVLLLHLGPLPSKPMHLLQEHMEGHMY